MTLKTWGSENPASADINGMFNECLIISGLNLIREMVDHDIDFSAGGFDWFGDAYIDANGRENSVDIDKNLTGAIFDTNKYKVPAFAEETEYIIIEATSMGTWTNGTNDTYVNKIGVDKWIVWCDTGTDAVKRAQIHKSLWYGTNNTNQLILDFTTITSIQTSNANDVGKRAYNIYAHEANCLATNTVVGTFSSASDNAAVSSWSRLTVSEGGSGTTITWENPTGTILNNASSGGGNANELGTDREADETNNPATCKINITAHNGYNPRAWIIVLTAQTISWANTGFDTFTEIDFYTDNSIPVMIAVGAITAEVDYSPIVHTIPSGTFSSTMSSAIGVPFVEDWETGADIQYKLTGTGGAEDTGWLDAGITPEISSFTTFTDEPDTLIVKLVPKTTSPTAGTPSLRGFSIRAT